MTEMSAAEAATVARFEAGEPAPESWRGDDGLREAIRKLLFWGVDTGVGTTRKATDAILALPEIAALRAKAAAADRVEDLLRTSPTRQIYISVIRRALDGPDRTDRGRC